MAMAVETDIGDDDCGDGTGTALDMVVITERGRAWGC